MHVVSVYNIFSTVFNSFHIPIALSHSRVRTVSKIVGCRFTLLFSITPFRGHVNV